MPRSTIWGAVSGAVAARLSPGAGALAVTSTGAGQHSVRDSLGSQLASGAGGTNVADQWHDVNDGPNAGHLPGDYAFSRGMGGDRYARAGSDAGIATPDLLLEGTGIDLWSDTAVATGTGIADITALFCATVTFTDELSLADRNNVTCDGSIDCSNHADADFDFSRFSEASFAFQVEDSVTLERWSLFADFGITREITREPDGHGGSVRYALDHSQATSTGYYWGCGGTCNEFRGSGALPLPIEQNDAPYAISGERTLAIAVPFVEGRSHTFLLSVTCTSEAAALARYMSTGLPALSSCEATNSGYLSGFENFRDANGNPIAPFASPAAMALTSHRPAPPHPAAPRRSPSPPPGRSSSPVSALWARASGAGGPLLPDAHSSRRTLM